MTKGWPKNNLGTPHSHVDLNLTKKKQVSDTSWSRWPKVDFKKKHVDVKHFCDPFSVTLYSSLFEHYFTAWTFRADIRFSFLSSLGTYRLIVDMLCHNLGRGALFHCRAIVWVFSLSIRFDVTRTCRNLVLWGFDLCADGIAKCWG